MSLISRGHVYEQLIIVLLNETKLHFLKSLYLFYEVSVHQSVNI